MLSITPHALKKLVEALQAHTKDPQMGIRITLNPSVPKTLDLILDSERKGDCILRTKDGIKLLLIQSHLALKLEGLILDYEEVREDFVISPVTRH